MPTCPRCDQTVAADAVVCPHCRLELKAYGHPGMTLYRAEQDTYLCDTCRYHLDDTCNFPQRPTAKTCTLYEDVNAVTPPPAVYRIPWWRRHLGWIALGVVVAVSLAIALL
ncbi:MAG: zinc ribbon domain-containing protein [Leptolyngbya sp. SIO4C1]|nr:zinc ribbon domain-containing protein [Leptolyngbya sp. SIO4C1]